MRVLFIGDLVGTGAVDYVVERLPALRETHRPDVVIANAENCYVSGPSSFTGFGMDVRSIERLLGAGVDVITSGNHAWDGPEAEAALAHPRVLRPFNLPEHYAGKGSVTIEVGGEPVTVVNAADQAAIPDACPVYPAFLEAAFPGTVIVDFHGGDVMQKLGFAHALDGHVAAVLGTHTHEPTETLHLLPGGTALVIDVGMTGPTGGWQGIDPTRLVAWYRGEDTSGMPPYALASGPIALGAVLLEIAQGRTASICRVR